MVNVRKRGNFYQYQFEVAPINGKRKQVTKSGFKTKAEAEKAGIKAYNEYSVPAIFQAVTPISMLKSKMVSFLKFKKRKVKKPGRASSKALPILKYIIKNLNSYPFVFSRY